MEFFIMAFIIFLDQTSKYAAIKYLQDARPYIIIENFLQFNYVENRGAAFGILEHKRLFFIIITFIIIIFLTFYLVRNYKALNIFIKFSLAMLIAGATGNLIDRIRLGYVVDFIGFRLNGYYNFPVFNIADISIVISTFLIVLMILFDKVEI